MNLLYGLFVNIFKHKLIIGCAVDKFKVETYSKIRKLRHLFCLRRFLSFFLLCFTCILLLLGLLRFFLFGLCLFVLLSLSRLLACK